MVTCISFTYSVRWIGDEASVGFVDLTVSEGKPSAALQQRTWRDLAFVINCWRVVCRLRLKTERLVGAWPRK